MKKKDLAKKMGPTLKKFYKDFYKPGHAGASRRPSYKELEERFHKAKEGPESHKASMDIYEWSKTRNDKRGGTSTFKKQSRATRNSHQLPSNKILRPAKRKHNDSDYY